MIGQSQDDILVFIQAEPREAVRIELYKNNLSAIFEAYLELLAIEADGSIGAHFSRINSLCQERISFLFVKESLLKRPCFFVKAWKDSFSWHITNAAHRINISLKSAGLIQVLLHLGDAFTLEHLGPTGRGALVILYMRVVLGLPGAVQNWLNAPGY